MLDLEQKRTELITRLTLLLDTHKIHVYYAEHDKAIPRGSNVSKCDRLAVPLSGCHRMEIVTGGEVEQISPLPGSVVFMPTGIWNRPDWVLPVETATFGFEEDRTWVSIVEKSDSIYESRMSSRIVGSPLSDEGRRLLKFFNEVNLNAHGDQRGGGLANALLYYCLDAIRQVHNTQPHGKAYHTWYLITIYIEEHYAYDISREEVSHLFKVTPNYISSLFKKQAGCGFIEYLNKLRLTKACFLLRRYNQTLDEIVMDVGFSSAAYFCRLFKQSYGITPTEYRNSALPFGGSK